ncbi:MAG: tetratricopeptide repeat protein [Planctomycetia bacterium]|nr:tetratricopeptide repeat protein [Planctomycetia bacterium]
MPSADIAWVFRHALLRDVAYRLQMPADRARLHAQALAGLEALSSGPAPEPPPLVAGDDVPEPHASDAWAEEMAGHAREAGEEAAERRWLRRAAEQAERQARGGAVEMWKRHAELTRGAERGESLRRAGRAAHLAGRSAAAQSLLEEALRIQRGLGQARLEGAALASLAQVFQDTGRWKDAAGLFEEALRLSRAAGDAATEVFALKQQAWLFHLTGLQPEAEATYARALDVARQTGLRRLDFVLRVDLTAFHSRTGREEAAERDLHALLADPRADPRCRGVLLGNLSSILFDTGRFAEAEPLLLEALSLARETGNRSSEALLLGGVTQVLARAGRTDEAIGAMERALALDREMGWRHQEGLHLNALADLLGNAPAAEDAYVRSAAILEDVGDTRHAGVTRGRLAEIRRRLGRPGEAEAEFRHALELHRAAGDRVSEALSLRGLALALLATGRAEEARAAWKQGGEFATAPDGRTDEMREACRRAGVAAFA